MTITTDAIELRLFVLAVDLDDAARLLEDLYDDDLAFDLACELHAARKCLKRASDVLNALPAFERRDAEPLSCDGVESYGG